jgi:GTP-binding protein of the ras superfamily involved in termination of M-phase
VGTKYDIFSTFPGDVQAETDKLARKYASAMNASLVFTSASHSVNIQRMFKVVLAKVFQLKTTVEEISGVGEPILLFI